MLIAALAAGSCPTGEGRCGANVAWRRERARLRETVQVKLKLGAVYPQVY